MLPRQEEDCVSERLLVHGLKTSGIGLRGAELYSSWTKEFIRADTEFSAAIIFDANEHLGGNARRPQALARGTDAPRVDAAEQG
jgi:hypothetical protein